MALRGSSGSTPTVGKYSVIVRIDMPDRFRLGLRLGRLSRLVRPTFKALGSEVELNVQELLTTAALRHGGAPYKRNHAILKETALWQGWLGVHGAGPLAGRLLVGGANHGRGNSARLSEFSCSLAESVSLAFMVDVLKIPMASIVRIPERGTEAMDFRSSLPGGSAIEAKGRHGNQINPTRKIIAKQMRRQKVATTKYGCIVCYERDGSTELAEEGSFVYIYDPKSDSRSAHLIDDILGHYLRVAQSIGFWFLVDAIRGHLKLPARIGASNPEELPRRLAAISGLQDAKIGHLNDFTLRSRIRDYGPGMCIIVGGTPYFVRAFESDSSDLFTPGNTPSLQRFLFFGLSLNVASALARFLLDPSDLNSSYLMDSTVRREPQTRRTRGKAASKDGGPRIIYSELEDGVLRVDAWLTDYEFENLDLDIIPTR